MSLLLSVPYTKEHLHCRKIKCPRHYVLKKGGQPFVMERNPMFKHIKEADAKKLGINVWRRKKDRWGQWVQNFADYEQPYVAASYCKENIYQPLHPICGPCRRCLTQ